MTTTFGRIVNGSAPYIQFLTQSGDGTGPIDAIGNYSAQTEFYFQPSSNEILWVSQLIVSVGDNGTVNNDDYGAINGGLTNGIDIRVRTDGVTSSLLTGNRIKNNQSLYAISRNNDNINLSGNNRILQVSLDFSERFGAPLVLHGSGTPDRVSVILQDDFTKLEMHRFLVLGVKR